MPRPSSAAAALRRAGPHVRAAFIVFHLAAVILMALPAPVGGERLRTYRAPQMRIELRQWSEALGAVGIEVEPEALGRFSHTWAVRLLAWRKTLLRPFSFYYGLCGTEQSWRMFSSANRYNMQLQVDAHRGRAWQRLYESRSAELRWHADPFDHELLRSAVYRYTFDDGAYGREYRELAEWFARRALAEMPDLHQVRVQVLRTETPGPEETRAGARRSGRVRRRVLIDPRSLR